MSRTHLISGGAGNLACQLARLIQQRGDDFVLMDIAEAPIIDAVGDAVYQQVDTTDAAAVEAVFSRHQPQVVIHFASLLSGSTEADRQVGWRVNADGAFTMIETALRHGVEQFFFPSSITAYGGALPDVVPEDYPQWPCGLYGVTKVAIERLGHYYHLQHGLDFRCIRLPAVVSAYAPPGAATAYASRAFVESVQNGRFTFNVQPRSSMSIIYIKDVLSAILQLLDAAESRLTRRVYNVQALSPTAEQIAAAIQSRLPGVELTFQPNEKLVSLVDNLPAAFDDRLTREDWGWSPQYDLEAMADDFLSELAP